MVLEMRAEFTQWGVGHGGFHTQRVGVELDGRASGEWRVVYDCGSTHGRADLSHAISEYAVSLRRQHATVVDRIFISHLDMDHVNGLVELERELRRVDARVAGIVIPLMTPLQRLALLLTQDGRVTPWYVDFLTDPEGVLGRFYPGAEIVAIAPGDTAEDAPSASNEPPADDSLPPDDSFAVEPPGDAEIVAEPLRTGGLRVGVRRPGPRHEGEAAPLYPVLWEMIPWVQTRVADRAPDYLQRLEEILEGGVPGTLTAQAVRALRRSSLAREALVEMFGDDASNLTSIALYSGAVAPRAVHRIVEGAGEERTAKAPDRTSWLGTGDGWYGDEIAQDLLAFLAPERVARIAAVAAPHHGSRFNSGAVFWTPLRGADVVTIHASGRHGHPHTETTDILDDLGLRHARIHHIYDRLTMRTLHRL